MKRTIFALAFFSLTLPAFGQGVDPLIGTWKLNVENSINSQLKSATQTWTGEGQTFINTAEAVDNQGQTIKAVFRHIYDGMPHQTTGSSDYDATTYTRIGNTINAVRFKQGKTVEVGRIVVVPGKSYSVTAEGVAANGQPYHYVLVFERQ